MYVPSHCELSNTQHNSKQHATQSFNPNKTCQRGQPTHGPTHGELCNTQHHCMQSATQTLQINNTIKRTLYLCIRESLQNTIKYAEATKFFIRFSSEKKEILLLLEDNGKGFEEGKGKKGIGLKNLKERVEEIHGSFHIESTEQGTKTTISIPINGR